MGLLRKCGVVQHNDTITGGLLSHANARLTPVGRLLMARRVEAGTPQAHVAAQMGVSRGAVAKRCRR